MSSRFFSALTSMRCTCRARTLVTLAVALACGASTLAAQGRQRGGAPDQSAPPRERVAPVLWDPEQIFPLASLCGERARSTGVCFFERDERACTARAPHRCER